jgi:DNA-directed RNA polymerase specialized sigma24 family protein
MQGDVADGQSAAASARDLQPPEQREKRDFSAPVSQGDLLRMDARFGRASRRLQRSVDRRLRDRQLVLVLARQGFQGRQYEHFVEELVRYGVSVLRGWMHSGYIFQLAAERGYGLRPHELDLEALASDSDLREELATMTVARALPSFRQRALVDGGWSYEGGASITTYFMGACLTYFPNEFRRYRSSQERQRLALQRQKAVYENPVHPLSAADEVGAKLQVLEELECIGESRTQAAVALLLDGYTQQEICQILGEPSVRAVEGLLYRWRQKAQSRRGGDRCG